MEAFSVGLSTLTRCNQGLHGFEDLDPAAVIQNEGSTYSNRNWCQQEALVNVPLDQSHRDTDFEKPSNDRVETPPPGIHDTLANVQNQQSVQQDQPQHFHVTDKGPAATSSQSHPPSTHGAPRHRYFCDLCDKGYSQRQGLTRHQREVHKPNLCRHCGTFEWGRLYLFKEHLERCHPHVDLNTELQKAQMNSRKAMMTTKYQPRGRVSSLALACDGRGGTETQLNPVMPPPFVVMQRPTSTRLPAHYVTVSQGREHVQGAPKKDSAFLPLTFY